MNSLYNILSWNDNNHRCGEGSVLWSNSSKVVVSRWTLNEGRKRKYFHSSKVNINLLRWKLFIYAIMKLPWENRVLSCLSYQTSFLTKLDDYTECTSKIRVAFNRTFLSKEKYEVRFFLVFLNWRNRLNVPHISDKYFLSHFGKTIASSRKFIYGVPR